jgi:pimeloyl-ACP methyl ester carboxylesterase
LGANERVLNADGEKCAMSAIRCGYVDGRHGQVHYRELGTGEPLVLLHWAPSNGRQYEHLMPAFAAQGFRVLAVDIPGYGRSHKDAAGWSCAQLAAEIAAALGPLGIPRGYALGGHLSAAIVAEMAILEPARWPRIVLDGSPTLTAEQMGELMRAFAGLSPAFDADGRHKSFAWDMTERFLTEWDPDYRVSPASLATHYAYMADYLQMGFAPIRAFIEPGSTPRGGLATYDAMARWPLITAKVLALTAEREALRAGHARGVAALRAVREHCYPGSHPLLDPSRVDEYVAPIGRFLRDRD